MASRWMAIAVVAVLAGCGNMPSSGPSALDITGQEFAHAPAKPYLVVKIDEKVTNVTGQYRPPSFSSFFRVPDAYPSIVLSVGDRVAVNIFEAGADGLFSSATSKATQIEGVVDAQGRLFVPYVGAVQAAGRTVDSLRANIEAALADKAIQPQVQVLVAESLANSVTVLGLVQQPGKVPVTVSGLRVLDVIAAAGGTSSKTYDTRILLRRGDQVASANLEDLFDNPKDNVPVRPEDVVLVTDVGRTFTVFGATGTRLEQEFAARRVTLAEGLARAGGLNDLVADARGIFLFRFEPDFIAKKLDERAAIADAGSMVPVIYRLDLKDPQSFFLMQLFELRDEDVIYVANHPAAQFAKFIEVIDPLLRNGTSLLNTYERFTRD